MLKVVYAALFTVMFTNFASADIKVTDVGSIYSGEIVRTLDKDQGIVCFSVRGTNQGDLSCLKRTVGNGPSPLTVGNISYGEIKKIFDDVYNVNCTIMRSTEGASISCL